MENYPVLEDVFCAIFLLIRITFFLFDGENPLKYYEFKSDNLKIGGSVIDIETCVGSGSVINNKNKTCAVSAEIKFKTKTKPFPLNVGEKSWKNKKKDKSLCLSATNCPKMVKHHPKKNYYVSQEAPDSSTEEDQIETASEDHLRHIFRFGTAFMGPPPPPPPVFVVPEIPPHIRAPNRIQHQNISSTSSADNSVILIEETIDVLETIDVFSADDEAEDDTEAAKNQGEVEIIQIIPNIEEAGPASGIPAQAVQITAAQAPPQRYSMRNYPPSVSYWVPTHSAANANQTYTNIKSWRDENPENDVRLNDSENYPESTPDFIRVGPNYPNDERPAYTKSECGRYVRFGGYTGSPERNGANANPVIGQSESSFLDQTTLELDAVYDSAENLNNDSNESEPAPNAELLLDLLESMRNINRQFRILFDQDVVFDENWPRQLSLSGNGNGIKRSILLPSPRSLPWHCLPWGKL